MPLAAGGEWVTPSLTTSPPKKIYKQYEYESECKYRHMCVVSMADLLHELLSGCNDVGFFLFLISFQLGVGQPPTMVNTLDGYVMVPGLDT